MSGNIVGWYYLHTNGDLIYKPGSDAVADIRESDFARSMWPCIPTDRESCWTILVEALSLGARKSRIEELAAKWYCDDTDAEHYADRLDIRLQLDGNQWCATGQGFDNLQESPAGFGYTKLEAMAALCNDLGYTGGKMWNATFATLLNGPAKPQADAT